MKNKVEIEYGIKVVKPGYWDVTANGEAVQRFNTLLEAEAFVKGVYFQAEKLIGALTT